MRYDDRLAAGGFSMLRRLALSLAMLFSGALSAQNLNIYWIDVEGGAATLIVSPGGQSLLVDTGWRRDDNRDPKRIYEAATKQAGLKKIDSLLITHFHMDHVGGAAGLAKLISIDKYLDHGDRVETRPGADAENWASYQALSAGKRTILKPGDKIPLSGLDVLVVASDGEHIACSVNGGGANAALCRDAKL